MSNWFSERARMAGVPEGYTAHGLRKARAIELVMIGCNPHEVGAWTGHESLKEIELYTKEARKRLLLGGGRRSG